MDRLGPPLDTPTLLPTDLALLEVGELPEMMDCVKVADLHEPSTHALHDLASGLEAPTPVCLPLEQVAWVQCVRSELKETTELAWRGRRPEGKLLHERRVFRLDQAPKLAVEGGIFWMFRDGVHGGMVALVALVFPDVD